MMDRLQTAVLLRRYHCDLKKEIDQLTSELPDELSETILSTYFPEIETKRFPCLIGLVKLANSMQDDINILMKEKELSRLLSMPLTMRGEGDDPKD